MDVDVDYIESDAMNDVGEATIQDNDNIENDEEGAESDDGEGEEGGRRVRKSGERKKPTGEGELTPEDLAALRETEGLFESNVFSLQVQELLKEISPNYTQTHALETAMKLVKTVLEQTTSKQLNSDEIAANFPSLNFLNPSEEISLKYIPPSNIAVIGSYLLKTQAKPELNVDISVEIPAGTMRSRDIKNYRYFDKRKLYLAVIAQELKAEPQFSDMEFGCFRGDLRKPILRVFPKIDSQKKSQKQKSIIINIIPTVKQHLFPPKKLLPTKHNSGSEEKQQQQQQKEEESESPNYNFAIVEDMLFERHMQLIDTVTSKSPSLRSAIMLFKVWLRQRGMTTHSYDSMNGFLMTMLIVHLAQTNSIDTNLSPDQIFRGIITWLVNNNDNWKKNGIFMKLEKENSDDQENIEETRSDLKFTDEEAKFLLARFPLVFVDPSGRLNLCWRISESAWLEFLYEVKLTHALLTNSQSESFSELFILPRHFHSKCDMMVQIEFDFSSEKDPQKRVRQFLTYESYDHNVSAQKVVSVLREGYGTRLNLIRNYVPRAPLFWDIHGRLPMQNEKGNFYNQHHTTIGLFFNDQEYRRLVDLGPQADDSAAVGKFTQFWGDKSEIRRFRDGSIVASVVWKSATLEHRYLIIREIFSYLVNRHFSNTSQKINYTPIKKIHFGFFGGDESLVHNFAIPPTPLTLHVTQTEAHAQITQQATSLSVHGLIQSTWQDLVQKIIVLSEIPLQIREIENVSSVYKFTEPIPPFPVMSQGSFYLHHKECGSSMEGIIIFQGSGAWPDNLEAFKNVKTAFYLSIGAALKKNYHLDTHATPDGLHVIFNGYIWKFLIFHPKEILLNFPAVDKLNPFVRSLVDDNENNNNKPTTTPQLTQSSALQSKSQVNIHAIEISRSTIHKSLVGRRLLVGHVRSLHTRCHSYGTCVRLALRWLGSHFLLSHYHRELVELLVAVVYCVPNPPNTYVAGFIGFINLLATFDFANEPLIIDFFSFERSKKKTTPTTTATTTPTTTGKKLSKLSAADVSAVRDYFANISLADRPPIFVSYVEDLYGSVWSWDKPGKEAFYRTVQIAKSAKNLLDSKIFSVDNFFGWSEKWNSSTLTWNSRFDWSPLFTSAISDFDALIWLKPDVLPNFQSDSLEFLEGVRIPPEIKKFGDISDFGKKKKRRTDYKNMQDAAKLTNMFIDLDPGKKLLQELESYFDNLALFYYNPYGCVIGVSWKPLAFLPSTKFTLAKSQSTIPISKEASDEKSQQNQKKQKQQQTNSQNIFGTLPNIFSVISDIQSIGKDIVFSVELVTGSSKISH